MNAQEVLKDIDERTRAHEPLYQLEETLHLTADGRAVSEDDPDGAFVLGAKGRNIPRSVAESLGLVKSVSEEHAEEIARLKAELAEAKQKAVAPQQNKAVRSRQTK